MNVANLFEITIILEHGPHVPRALEVYRGKLIAYSLGNFIGYRTLSTQGELGYSLILETRLAADGQLLGAQVIPLVMQGAGISVRDHHKRTIKLIQKLNRLDMPKCAWVLGDDGVMRPLTASPSAPRNPSPENVPPIYGQRSLRLFY